MEAIEEMEQKLGEEIPAEVKEAIRREAYEVTERNRRLTSEEVSKSMATLTKSIENLREQIGTVRSMLEKHREYRERHTGKYGTIEAPRLIIAPEYSPPETKSERFLFLRPAKDAEYREIVFALYEATRLLRENIRNLRILEEGKHLDVEELLPRSQELLRENKHLQRTYVGTDGKEIRIDSASVAAGLAYAVSDAEIDLLNRSLTIFDILSNLRDAQRLKELRPDLFESEKDPESVRTIFDSPLRRIVHGYPVAFPRIVIHPSEKEFTEERERQGMTADAAAYHSPAEDLIVSHGDKNRLEQLISMAHECGHVLAQVSEHGSFKVLMEHEGLLRDFEKHLREVEDLQQLLSTLNAPERFTLPLKETPPIGVSVPIDGSNASAAYLGSGKWIISFPGATYQRETPVMRGERFCAFVAERKGDSWRYPLCIPPRSSVAVSIRNPTAEQKRHAQAIQDIMTFNMNQMMLGTRISIMSLSATFDPDYIHAQLDEASAYLFQDLLLRETFKDHPEVMQLVGRVRDYSNGTSQQDVEHTGAYLFAEEVLQCYGGDSMAALNELAFLTDGNKLKEYEERITALNSSQGIIGGPFGGILSSLKEFEDIEPITNHKIAVSNKVVGLIKERGEREDDATYAEELRQRIAKLDAEIAEMFGKLLERTYEPSSVDE